MSSHSPQRNRYTEPIEFSIGVSLRSGVKGGFFFAIFCSVIVIGRMGLMTMGLAVMGHLHATTDVPTMARLLEFVVPGYFLGFIIAGVCLAAASRIQSRMLRYAFTGLLCGTAIYGAMGISEAFIDAKAIDWREIGEIAGVLGGVFGLLGLIMGGLDDWRSRRRAEDVAP